MEAEMNTKEKIISATIELIQEEMSVDKITVRRIAKKADVGVSMINYHFQTKENLINIAVQNFISTVIDRADDRVRGQELSPTEKLRFGTKQAAGFLAHYPGISRVSILSDLKNCDEKDNSSQSFNSIYNQLKRIYGENGDSIELQLKAQQILAGLQEIFLRAPVFLKQTGLDYYNDQDRDKIVDKLIDNILV